MVPGLVPKILAFPVFPPMANRIPRPPAGWSDDFGADASQNLPHVEASPCLLRRVLGHVAHGVGGNFASLHAARAGGYSRRPVRKHRIRHCNAVQSTATAIPKQTIGRNAIPFGVTLRAG